MLKYYDQYINGPKKQRALAEPVNAPSLKLVPSFSSQGEVKSVSVFVEIALPETLTLASFLY